MTPDERYGLQIASVACGMVGTGIAWYALFSNSWRKSENTSHMTSIKTHSLWLNDRTYQSRGLFATCKTVENIKFMKKDDRKQSKTISSKISIDDSITCCSEYTSHNFPLESNMHSRILIIQQLGVWGVSVCTVGAVLLFVSMCHMSGNIRQKVRYSAVAFTALTFILLVTCMGMFSSWSKNTSFELNWSKMHISDGTNAMAMAVTLIGISCIFIGISTHKATYSVKLKQ